MSLPTYYGEVFAAAHSLAKRDLKNGDPVTLTLSFIGQTSEGKIEHDKETDLTVYTVDSEGLCHASICTGDLDNDGWKNDVALLVMTTKKVRLFVYTVTYNRENGSASLAKRYEKLIDNDVYYINVDNVNDPQFTTWLYDDSDYRKWLPETACGKEPAEVSSAENFTRQAQRLSAWLTLKAQGFTLFRSNGTAKRRLSPRHLRTVSAVVT